MIKALRFNFSTQVYTSTIEIDVDEWCNSISVKNNGASTLIFQGDILGPGEFKTIGGNYGEVLEGRIDIRFTGAGANLAAVTQKFYYPFQLTR